MRKSISNRGGFLAIGLLLLALLASSCLPKPPAESGGANITLYGFSIMKESLEKSIYPGFSAKWKIEHGVDVRFTSSFAGSETVTNQILQGVNADIAILSIERDAERLRQGGFVTSDWHAFPNKGIIKVKSEKQTGEPNQGHALQTLRRSGITLSRLPARRARRAHSLRPASVMLWSLMN